MEKIIKTYKNFNLVLEEKYKKGHRNPCHIFMDDKKLCTFNFWQKRYSNTVIAEQAFTALTKIFPKYVADLANEALISSFSNSFAKKVKSLAIKERKLLKRKPSLFGKKLVELGV
jgi:hypothetical protein